MLQIKLLQRRKKCLIFNFQDVQTGHSATKINAQLPLPTTGAVRPKQTYFSYSLDKALNLPEFQVKSFFSSEIHWAVFYIWVRQPRLMLLFCK